MKTTWADIEYSQFDLNHGTKNSSFLKGWTLLGAEPRTLSHAAQANPHYRK